MGSSDADKPTKANTVPPVAAAVAAVGAQPEQAQAGSSSAATPAVYPDWSGFQAYPPIPPHGFFQPGSQTHPYMWGPQPLMSPYGTPPSPYVMYPHGVYAHPSMQLASHPFSPYAIPPPNGNVDASGAVATGMEVDGKSSDGKEKSPIKRSKGSLGSLNMITGKGNNDMGKTSGASANGMSQSGESGRSGSEGSSDGSDDNSHNESRLKSQGEKESCGVDTHQNGVDAHKNQNGGPTHPSSQGLLSHPMPIMPMPATGIPAGLAGPTTALNIGMEYWGAPNSTAASVRGKVPANSVAATRENAPSELWPQDERELKRQRRKQSNRESARRSRLRKQAECEELAQRVDVLKEENVALRAEVDQIRKEYEQLLAQNTSLKERLGGVPLGTDDTRHGRDGTHQPMDSNAGPQNGL